MIFGFKINPTDVSFQDPDPRQLVNLTPHYAIEKTFIPFRSVKKPMLTPVRHAQPYPGFATPQRGVQSKAALVRYGTKTSLALNYGFGSVVGTGSGRELQNGSAVAAAASAETGGVGSNTLPVYSAVKDFWNTISFSVSQAFSSLTGESQKTGGTLSQSDFTNTSVKFNPFNFFNFGIERDVAEPGSTRPAPVNPACGFYQKADPDNPGKCIVDPQKAMLYGILAATALVLLMPGGSKQPMIVLGGMR